MQKLSPRLSVILDAVPECLGVCDVGTDHGFLAAALALSGKVARVTATDINEKPLENAAKTLERLGMSDRVKLILCDGLSGVSRDMADTVIIAGMGGDVISGILSRCDFVRDNTVTLILQPMTAADDLRDYLAKNGFCVQSETAVCDNKKIYSVMTARFSGQPYEISAVRRRIGLLRPDSSASFDYIEKQYRICKRCAEDMADCSDLKKQHLEMNLIADDLKKILEEKHGV